MEVGGQVSSVSWARHQEALFPLSLPYPSLIRKKSYSGFDEKSFPVAVAQSGHEAETLCIITESLCHLEKVLNSPSSGHNH